MKSEQVRAVVDVSVAGASPDAAGAGTDGLRDIDAPVAALLALFRAELADVRFPDVDAATLEEAADAVAGAVRDVETARAALERAGDALRRDQRALRERARLAYRYARVFATGNDALTATLDGISLDDPPAATPKKRRGRKPKSRGPSAPQLALEEDGAPSAARP